ncbi:hypothetical protein SBV1_2480020 [Verrucomicrobia bacterium]|nr:hypothetical protein SBV1_2480020 [Verrucomicrobiota bacterium]
MVTGKICQTQSYEYQHSRKKPARTGKIARLPRHLREELNERLHTPKPLARRRASPRDVYRINLGPLVDPIFLPHHFSAKPALFIFRQISLPPLISHPFCE